MRRIAVLVDRQRSDLRPPSRRWDRRLSEADSGDRRCRPLPGLPAADPQTPAAGSLAGGDRGHPRPGVLDRTHGVQLIDSTGSSDVQLDIPSFGYDRLLRHYVMSASFTWKMCRIGDVESAPCWLKNRHDGMGGPDGFAIKLNQEIFRVRSGFSLADNCGRPAGSTNPPSTATTASASRSRTS